MKKNLRLMVIDECNDTYCFKAFCVPDAETLTRDEVEAFKAVLLSCATVTRSLATRRCATLNIASVWGFNPHTPTNQNTNFRQEFEK